MEFDIIGHGPYVMFAPVDEVKCITFGKTPREQYRLANDEVVSWSKERSVVLCLLPTLEPEFDKSEVSQPQGRFVVCNSDTSQPTVNFSIQLDERVLKNVWDTSLKLIDTDMSILVNAVLTFSDLSEEGPVDNDLRCATMDFLRHNTLYLRQVEIAFSRLP
ncbi:MAG: hypothetical protein PHC51_04115 [bacterium]|nr:hypothetical protein [bacterium]